jgi:flagellar motor switch/type III secretory pathway protein FliN
VIAIQYSLTTSLGSFSTHWIAPRSFLEEHLDCVFDDAADAPENTSLEMLAGEIPVSIAVELGRKTVPLSRIRSLQEHDVIVLDQSIHEPLRILVEGAVKMAGLPGRSDNRQLIKVVAMCEE